MAAARPPFQKLKNRIRSRLKKARISENDPRARHLEQELVLLCELEKVWPQGPKIRELQLLE